MYFELDLKPKLGHVYYLHIFTYMFIYENIYISDIRTGKIM